MRESFAALTALVVVVSTVGLVPLAGGTAVDVTVSQAGAQQCTEGSAAYPLELTDATDATVTVDAEPERVVTLNPSAAQTMWELDAEQKVVGVSQFAAYLDGAGEKANVSTSTFARYDAEEILSLQADLVLAPNTIPTREVERLRGAGLTVYKFDTATSIADVREKTLLTGALVGECRAARETVRWMDENLAAVESAVADRDRPRAMYLSFGGSVGANTFIHDVLVTSGTTNVVAEAGQTGFLQQVNAELVVERDPQYLLVSSRRDPALSRAPFNATTAVEQDQLAVVNVNYLAQPAPRSVVFAVRNVTETVHGDVYGPADYVSRQAAAQTATATPTATATATATDTSTAGPTTTATATETPTDGGGQAQPGFGVAVAVLAVLGALALLRRRE